MKRIGLFAAALVALFCAMLAGGRAQDQPAVPIDKEPHHHLVLENEYVRVFRVSVPGRAETLLHQHNVPYIYLSLGQADVTNAVQGKAEAKLLMADGQIGYSRGNFAHIAKVNTDADFNNVTIELLKEQGEPRNLCEKVIDGPLDCGPGQRKPVQVLPGNPHVKRFMETDEVYAAEGVVEGRVRFGLVASRYPQLLIAGQGAALQIEVAGQGMKTLHTGEVLWLPAGSAESVSRDLVTTDVTGMAEEHASRYLLLSFKD